MRDWIEIISSIITTLIILIGGIFAWWKWGREKPQVVRADLSHKIFLAPLDGEKYVLRVMLNISNRGNTRINLKSGWTELRKVAPVDKEIQSILSKNNHLADNGTEIAWPAFAKRVYDGQLLGLEIDSGEAEQLCCDFIIPKSHQVIVVKSEIYFDREPKTMWPCSTLVNLESFDFST
jgi:hypothetical protein